MDKTPRRLTLSEVIKLWWASLWNDSSESSQERDSEERDSEECYKNFKGDDK